MPVISPAVVANQLQLRLPRTPSTAIGNKLAEAGELLRSTREQLGLSLAEVNRDLRISRTQLTYMEAGEFERISSVPALRDGHVRTYALYLGLDLQPIMDAVHSQAADDATAEHEPLYPPPPRRNPLAYVMMGISLVILVLLIMAWDRLSTVEAYLPADGVEAAGLESPTATVPSSSLQRIGIQSEFSE